MKLIGIDIGGTMIKFGVINQKGEILEQKEVPTLKEGNLIDTLYKEIEILGACDAIGISSAGQIDPQAGVLVHSVKQLNTKAPYH